MSGTAIFEKLGILDKADAFEEIGPADLSSHKPEPEVLELQDIAADRDTAAAAIYDGPLPQMPPVQTQAARDALLEGYRTVRQMTEKLVEPLTPEDQNLQSMDDASPAKWHRAHTTWFFETFLLQPHQPAYCVFDEHFNYLFNSYYEAVGERHPRPERGILSRPTADTVTQYRRYVDAAMEELIARIDDAQLSQIAPLLALGLAHEQQHQELILTDIKHAFWRNPVSLAYQPAQGFTRDMPPPLDFVSFAGGIVEIGHDGHGFAFDNEGPRHDVLLRPYALADRLVTQGEWLAFIDAGGYTDSRWWLASGWDWRRAQGIEAPLYWRRDGARWSVFTLHGRVALDADAPAVHMSYYEADAYARWRAAHDGLPCRLPTEAEWEHAAQAHEAEAVAQGHFVESGVLQPQAASPSSTQASRPRQLFGDAWEWTASAYLPYPGYRPWAGAVGEYNGKFMINQMVLRGGSCATPRDHIRASYRNFFPTDARWQFSGMRLARDLD
jgi:ergothioneine biosynthesis protein EgtB